MILTAWLPCCLFLATLPAAADIQMHTVGAWGGEVQTVFVDEAVDPYTAYVGSGRNLVVLDVTDPANVVELGRIDLGDMVLDVKVRGAYAFVGTYANPNNFCTVDVSDPDNLRVAWHSGDHTGAPEEVVLYGDLAFVRWSGDLWAFDISDPEAVGTAGVVIASIARAFTIDGDRLYVGQNDSSGWPRLRIYDLTAPWLDQFVDHSRLQLLGMGALAGAPHGFNPQAVRVAGDYAYMALLEGFLALWDVSDPTAPTHLYTPAQGGQEAIYGYESPDGGNSGGLAVGDGVVYFTDGYLKLIDAASIPTGGIVLSSFAAHGAVGYVEVVGTRAYAMSPGEGLIIVDVSTPASPARLGDWYSPGYPRKMAKVGDLLYFSDGGYGVTILDVSDPSAPALVGRYETSEALGQWGRNWDLAVRDGLVYLAAGYGGLEVVDVSDPAAPFMVGNYASWPLGLRSVALDLDGEIAHLGVSPGNGGIMVNFDISDPAHIVDVGFVWLNAPPIAIATRPDGLAHVTGGTELTGGGGHVDAIDTSDPANPFLVSEVDLTPGNAPKGLAIDGDLRFVTNWYDASNPGSAGLYIQDVSDPANPVDVGFFEAGAASSVDLHHGLAYIVAYWPVGWPSLQVIDVSDPAAPVVLDHLLLPSAWEVLVDPPYAYITGGTGGDAGIGLQIVYAGVPGDLNGDLCVGLSDLAALLSNYGATGGASYATGDLDGDGDVDLSDLAELLSHYGDGCQPTGPTGACCLPDGTCVVLTEPDCVWYQGGVYHGDDTTCDGVTCPPTGACCVPYGSVVCQDWTEDACLAHGGTWYGEGTDCSTTACSGACCDPLDGTCSDLRESACEAAGGVYQGDGSVCGPDTCDPVGACCLPTSECVIRTAFGCSELGGLYYGDGSTCETVDCPYAAYANEISTVMSYLPSGTGLMIADDMTLEGNPDARDLIYLDLAVATTEEGHGPYDVTVGLYTDCPGNGGTLIPGTEFTWPGVPGVPYYYYILSVEPDPPVTIPETVWMVAEFSRSDAGWIVAEQAETGFTDDLFGRNDPPWVCNYVFQNHDPYAGFWANLRCQIGETKASGGDGPVLRMEAIEVGDAIHAAEVSHER